MKGLVVLLLVAQVACADKKKGEDGEPPAAQKPAAPVAERKPAGRALQAAEVEGLLERWKSAQNQGDFAAYQALYARKMTGVKRVGARVFRFDRGGWMIDRGRMFKKKMEVAADEVKVAVAGPSATVRFQQTFKQRSFQDVGRKELVVVREEGDLRIAREEMLSSAVVGKDGAVAAGAAGGGTFLMLDGEVLLEEAPGVDVTGAPALDPGEGSASFRARAAVDRAGVPLAGKAFTVYGARGATCKGTLDSVSVVAGITPHFGTVAEWRGQAEAPALSDGQIAQEVWSSGQSVLVGKVGACDGLVARTGGPPVVAFEEVSDDKLATAVLASFRKLDAWEKTQHEFAATDERGAWDREGAIVHIFRHPTSGKMWAVVHATGGDMCSGFAAEMTAVFEQSGKTWKDVSGAALEQFDPDAAFDLDGDGVPELVAPRILVGHTADGFETLQRFDYPDHDCPC